MRFAVVCVVAIAASVAALAQDVPPTPRDEPPPAKGKRIIDAAWFGADPSLEFRFIGPKHFDALTVMWVKPGFELRGKRVRFAAWDAPLFPSERYAGDAKAAAKFVATFPPLLRETLSTKLNPPVVPVETDAEAEVLFHGRVVDCESMVVLFQHPSVTIDVKVLDARTGELLAAIHNRRAGLNLASALATVLLNLSETGFQTAYASARSPCEK